MSITKNVPLNSYSSPENATTGIAMDVHASPILSKIKLTFFLFLLLPVDFAAVGCLQKSIFLSEVECQVGRENSLLHHFHHPTIILGVEPLKVNENIAQTLTVVLKDLYLAFLILSWSPYQNCTTKPKLFLASLEETAFRGH